MAKLKFTITTEIEIDLDLYRVDSLEEAAKQQQDEWDNEQLSLEDIIEASNKFEVRIEAIKEKT